MSLLLFVIHSRAIESPLSSSACKWFLGFPLFPFPNYSCSFAVAIHRFDVLFACFITCTLCVCENAQVKDTQMDFVVLASICIGWVLYPNHRLFCLLSFCLSNLVALFVLRLQWWWCQGISGEHCLLQPNQKLLVLLLWLGRRPTTRLKSSLKQIESLMKKSQLSTVHAFHFPLFFVVQ